MPRPKLKTVLPTEIEQELEERRIEKKAATNPELAAMPERRRRLVLILLRDPGIPFRDAMRQAGYSVKSHSNQKTIKRAIQGALSETLREAGIYELDIARVILRALDATKYHKVPRETYDLSGKLKERKTDMIPFPDYKTQLAAAKLLAQLGGYFAASKLEVSGKITHERMFRNIDPAVLEQRVRELEEKGVKAEFEVVDDDY